MNLAAFTFTESVLKSDHVSAKYVQKSEWYMLQYSTQLNDCVLAHSSL